MTLRPYITRVSTGNAVVGCINTPPSTTLSGDRGAIEELEKLVKSDGHFARRLPVDVAYHSPHMRVVADQYCQALGDLVPQPEVERDGGHVIQMFSSLTGKEVKNSDLGSQYWVANMTGQVKFSGAVLSLVSI
jgi:acyl transferase domain-containing protein